MVGHSFHNRSPVSGALLAGVLLLLGACESDSGVLPGGRDGGAKPATDALADVSDDGLQGGGGPDASLDDGADQDARPDVDGATGVDAGHADAPPLCTPAGACSPFGPNSCGGQQTCRAETGGTVCGMIPPTPLAEDAPCEGTFECGPGLACINLNAQGARCHKLCPANQVGLCSAGKACSAPIAGETCMRLCAPLPPACDIYNLRSCPEANSKCDLSVHPETNARYTACLPAGVGQIGDACTGGSRCARGLVCINLSDQGARCRQVCNAEAASPVCSVTGQTCTGRSSLYGVTFCL